MVWDTEIKGLQHRRERTEKDTDQSHMPRRECGDGYVPQWVGKKQDAFSYK